MSDAASFLDLGERGPLGPLGHAAAGVHCDLDRLAHPDRAQRGVQRDDLGCEAGDDERLAAARGERPYGGPIENEAADTRGKTLPEAAYSLSAGISSAPSRFRARR
jgi:hypothetical protein